MGFKPCLADPDLWMKACKREDGTEYWAYVLLYVDDLMVIHHDAMSVLRGYIDKYFKLKPGSIGDPKMYLGATLKRVRLENGVTAWASSPAKYVYASVENVEKYIKDLGDDRWKLPKYCSNPFELNCEPEMDTTGLECGISILVCFIGWHAKMDG